MAHQPPALCLAYRFSPSARVVWREANTVGIVAVMCVHIKGERAHEHTMSAPSIVKHKYDCHPNISCRFLRVCVSPKNPSTRMHSIFVHTHIGTIQGGCTHHFSAGEIERRGDEDASAEVCIAFLFVGLELVDEAQLIGLEHSCGTSYAPETPEPHGETPCVCSSTDPEHILNREERARVHLLLRAAHAHEFCAIETHAQRGTRELHARRCTATVSSAERPTTQFCYTPPHKLIRSALHLRSARMSRTKHRRNNTRRIHPPQRFFVPLFDSSRLFSSKSGNRESDELFKIQQERAMSYSKSSKRER